ncbi:hypothetical protein [Bradyrhizobium sp. Leo170]|uniref:hypothetical protein n=1 Tax=Bradyrhizobium sp. Leo170 TaxID=1571199 RepID=UPI00102EC131|nr:hypothetical protein [Bradyrhizobium sp. Leo170]TAI60772.1 hypothetical protein CWO89_38810 [Bradyrhizobium sp. Leo170]
MSQILKGILGALAVSLTFGAVQFASGHDLIGGHSLITSTKAEHDVNRTAKADRAAVPAATSKTETISLKLDTLAETSVVIRVPVVRDEARSRPKPPALIKSGERRMTVACEPVVSVLTEVAKRLQPGRCVT